LTAPVDPPGADDPAEDAAPVPPRRPRGRRAASGEVAWFGRLNQLDFDIDFFERILARNPDSIDVLRVLGELASRRGLNERALELDRRLVARLPDDFLARYNLACSLALAGRADEAILCLGEAFRLGYDDVAHMEVDPDLASIRERPEFRALVGRA
jgi:tetratricopeptide (TPR) repeat protein